MFMHISLHEQKLILNFPLHLINKHVNDKCSAVPSEAIYVIVAHSVW